MADLIDRQAAIDAIENAFDRETILNRFVRKIAISVVRLLPSAQPEIIYCKNCIYYKWDINMCDYPYSTAHNVVHEYDYCSKAERKTDEP